MSAVPMSPWQERAYLRAVTALDEGRMGHAMVLCGPALLGKRAVADRLAAHVLRADRDTRAASLIAAGTHPDLLTVGLEPNRDGTRLRTEIVIEQIRTLTEKLSLTAQYGGARVAILDPADAINHAAANALLKTLEEPQPGRYLWLVAAEPMRLPATIRSRCQRLEFRLPPADEALAWLEAQGVPARDAEAALQAARGHPGLAAQWLSSGGMALRAAVADDLAALADGRRAPSEVAKAWTTDEHAGMRLRHASDLAAARAAGATDPHQMRGLTAWFAEANRTRDLLRTTVRADLAVTALLLAWRTTVGVREGQPHGRGTGTGTRR